MTRILIAAGAAIATGTILYLGLAGTFGGTNYITRWFTRTQAA